jgi:5'-nucleotidase/UDP-sugar diphosphatase
MLRWLAFILLFIPASVPSPVLATEKTLTIIHTNDMHSHLLGASPNIDYTPLSTGDDKTVGGWARISTLIREVKKNSAHPVLVLDGGDFMMGTLFHMLSREEAFELRLMHMMGYDAVTLGNHEFDLKPGGLARILTTARKAGESPPVVLSNAVFSRESKADDSLEDVFNRGLVQPYRVVEKGGIRIGLFGLMGKDAAEVAPFASPVHFADPIACARDMARRLREEEEVDMVVCLSHSGLSPDKDRSEDEILARQAAGIDVIISAHTHTKTEGALIVNGTIIAQAWEYGKQVGVLDVGVGEAGVTLKNYNLVDINDRIKGDELVTERIAGFESEINRRVLDDEHLAFNQIIAETDFDLYLRTDESNLGNLIADAMRWYLNQDSGEASPGAAGNDIAVISNGVIRDPIVVGQTGRIAVCDAFRAIPLGIGFDESETIGYPLIAIYIYPSELKKTLEILTSIYPLKGSDYFIQVSGVRFTYNPHRMIFDRVTEIWLGDEENGYRLLDYSKSNRDLIRVVADIYNATFLKIIGDFTWHVLDIAPKDRDGRPIADLKTARIDADGEKPGIQELKEWKAVIEYLQHLPDTDGDGIPNVPAKYRGRLGRIVVEAGWNPYRLLKRGTYVTWIALALFLLAGFMLFGIGWFVIKKIKSYN